MKITNFPKANLRYRTDLNNYSKFIIHNRNIRLRKWNIYWKENVQTKKAWI